MPRKGATFPKRGEFQGYLFKWFHLGYQEKEYDVLLEWYTIVDAPKVEEGEYNITLVVDCETACHLDHFPFYRAGWVEQALRNHNLKVSPDKKNPTLVIFDLKDTEEERTEKVRKAHARNRETSVLSECLKTNRFIKCLFPEWDKAKNYQIHCVLCAYVLHKSNVRPCLGCGATLSNFKKVRTYYELKGA